MGLTRHLWRQRGCNTVWGEALLAARTLLTVSPNGLRVRHSITRRFRPIHLGNCVVTSSRHNLPWRLWRRDSFSQATVPVVVQSLSCVRLFAIPWTIACQGPLSFAVSQSLLKFMFIELGLLSNHLTLCSSSPPALQPFPASGSFPMSQLSTSGGQSVGASA